MGHQGNAIPRRVGTVIRVDVQRLCELPAPPATCGHQYGSGACAPITNRHLPGTRHLSSDPLSSAEALAAWSAFGLAVVALATAIFSNVINNLPMALIAAATLVQLEPAAAQ